MKKKLLQLILVCFFINVYKCIILLKCSAFYFMFLLYTFCDMVAIQDNLELKNYNFSGFVVSSV